MPSERSKIFLCVFILIAAVFAFDKTAWASQSKIPFYPGEKLTYILKWEIIPAGEAVLEVYPIKKMKGIQAYHFVLMAKSNSFVDIFYKVRDRIDAYTDLKVTRSVFYQKKQREGSHQRDVIINFNWHKNKARYSNFGKKLKPITILPGTFDPLSAFYYTRFLDFQVNTHIERPVTDGKKIVIGRASIVKRERLFLKSGTYDTFLIEPEIKDLGGVFKKSKNAKIQIWVTADHRHIPVKVKSRVVVGSFTGELVSAERVR